ncbi:MAG: antibiotic biosynthesis monooxygenase [Ignavibacteria bacterium]|nr:antibiotic biosynthesis monooxygenase [Ignavibacteria bacterium]
MIYSVVTMIIKPGEMEKFIEECKKIRPLVLSEKGCLMYDYTREIQFDDGQEKINSNRITLYEKWESKEALENHNNMKYMYDFVQKVKTMRESVTVRIGEEVFI